MNDYQVERELRDHEERIRDLENRMSSSEALGLLLRFGIPVVLSGIAIAVAVLK